MSRFIPSSKANPCPICGRTHDGDCRRLDNGSWLCHKHRGEGLKPGDSAPSGAAYRFTSTSKDGAAMWGIWKPAAQWSDRGQPPAPRRSAAPTPARRKPPAAPTTQSKAAAMSAEITLTAKLIRPKAENPFQFARWDGTPVGATKVRVDHGDGRDKAVNWRPALSKEGLTTTDLAPWKWHETLAHHQQHGGPVIVLKGELKAQWLRERGLQAISILGWNDHIAAALQPLGADVVLAPDCDLEDLQGWYAKAAAALPKARHLLTPGANWAEPPENKGVGVDDWLQSQPAITAQEIAQAITAEGWGRSRAEALLEVLQESRTPDRADLQDFLSLTYKLEFNELTRVCEIDGHPLEDIHLADSFLAKRHRLNIPKQVAVDSLEFVAKSNPYNPVRRYLEGLKGRSDLRLIPMAELAAAFAIKKGDTLSQYFLAAHLAGCARRGIEPGYRHHQMLVFGGVQGKGKSEAIAALVPNEGWYDSTTKVEDLEGKDFLSKVNGCWLFEIEECDHSLVKRSAEEFKGFVTRRNARYVEKYEKAPKTHWRRSGLFGTTNQTEFLNDSTGNRRVWYIDTEARSFDLDWIRANRDSVWATVLTWIEWGLRNYLNPDEELALAAAERNLEASLGDPWEESLAKVLNSRPIDTTGGVAQEDLIRQALNIPIEQINRNTQMRVTRAVTGSGFRTHDGAVAWQQKKGRYGGGKSRSGYLPVPLAGEEQPCSSGSVPTVPTDSAPETGDGTGVGTALTPWTDRDLTTLFQPVPTFLEVKDMGLGNTYTVGTHTPVPFHPLDVGTGWNTPGVIDETPCTAADLAAPTSPEKDGTGLDQPSQRSEQPEHLGAAAPADLLAKHQQHLADNRVRSGGYALGADLDAFLDQQEISDADLAQAFQWRVQELIDQDLLDQTPLPTTAEEDAEAALDQARWAAEYTARAQISAMEQASVSPPPAEEFLPWQLALMQARLENPTAIAHTLLCTIGAPASITAATAKTFLETAAAQSWLTAHGTP